MVEWKGFTDVRHICLGSSDLYMVSRRRLVDEVIR